MVMNVMSYDLWQWPTKLQGYTTDVVKLWIFCHLHVRRPLQTCNGRFITCTIYSESPPVLFKVKAPHAMLSLCGSTLLLLGCWSAFILKYVERGQRVVNMQGVLPGANVFLQLMFFPHFKGGLNQHHAHILRWYFQAEFAQKNHKISSREH